MRLKLNDGYTLQAKTPSVAGDGLPIPVVEYSYRPVMPEALYEWRFNRQRATTGAAMLDADAAFIAGHLVSWDVMQGATVAKIEAATVKQLPQPYIDAMLVKVSEWTPGKESKWEKAEGNSGQA